MTCKLNAHDPSYLMLVSFRKAGGNPQTVVSVEEKERVEREEMLARAREAHKEQREKEEET